MEKQTKKLPVSEVFYSIQGEGQTMGVPAVFLRLGGCNLLCESKTWRCDSIEVWSKSKATAFEDVLPIEYIDHLKKNAHLIITGGEPMLHQDAIADYILYLSDTHNFKPVIEIETNGTIRPRHHLWQFGLISFWNVSPKLKSAGDQNAFEKRFNEEALRFFSTKFSETIFKFVVSTEDDLLEIFQDFAPYIREHQIVLMPAGSTREQLEKTRPFVVEKCKQLNLRYSERLQIVIWDKATGV